MCQVLLAHQNIWDPFGNRESGNIFLVNQTVYVSMDHAHLPRIGWRCIVSCLRHQMNRSQSYTEFREERNRLDPPVENVSCQEVLNTNRCRDSVEWIRTPLIWEDFRGRKRRTGYMTSAAWMGIGSTVRGQGTRDPRTPRCWRVGAKW